MRIAVICAIGEMVAILFGDAALAGEPFDEATFRADYPVAARGLETFYRSVHGSGEFAAKQGNFHISNHVNFWFYGDRERSDVVWNEDNPNARSNERKGREIVDVGNSRRAFSLVRPGQEKSFSISYIGIDKAEKEYEMLYYAKRFVELPLGLDVPFTRLMSDPNFKIKRIAGMAAEGRRLVRVEFDYRPAIAKSLYFREPDDVQRTSGWVSFSPEAHWSIQAIEVVNQLPDGKVLGRTALVEYGESQDGYPLPRFAKIESRYTESDTTSYEFRFAELEHGPSPESLFTATSFGFADLDTEIRSNRLPYLYMAIGFALLALSIAFYYVKRGPRGEKGAKDEMEHRGGS